jgi:hypothetical protein
MGYSFNAKADEWEIDPLLTNVRAEHGAAAIGLRRSQLRTGGTRRVAAS